MVTVLSQLGLLREIPAQLYKHFYINGARISHRHPQRSHGIENKER